MKFVSINNYFCDKKAFNIFKEVPRQILGEPTDLRQTVDLSDWEELKNVKEKYGEKLLGIKINVMFNMVDETNMARLYAETPKMLVKFFPDQQMPFEFKYFEGVRRETIDIFDLDSFEIEIEHETDLSQNVNPIITIHLQGVYINAC
jgi:hypothetical protein